MRVQTGSSTTTTRSNVTSGPESSTMNSTLELIVMSGNAACLLRLKVLLVYNMRAKTQTLFGVMVYPFSQAIRGVTAIQWGALWERSPGLAVALEKPRSY